MFTKREMVVAYLIGPIFGLALFLLAVELYTCTLGTPTPCRIVLNPKPSPLIEGREGDKLQIAYLASLPLMCLRKEAGHLMFRDPDRRLWGVDLRLIQDIIYLPTPTVEPTYPH